MKNNYQIVIGLEVHVELKSKSKIFCSCSTAFGAEVNSQVCPVCMGLPGALPVLNEQVVDYAIQAGLLTNCKIAPLSRMDRKHYFYPDLATSYQISQEYQPICNDGYLDINVEGESKRIKINRIHMEEDAGKLVQDENLGTLVDYNRAGVPLIEIVTEADLRSGQEVRIFLEKLRSLLLYADLSDCRMNEGSFRVDVNLSLREVGREALGTRTEMKNLNSFQSIDRAIDYESKRQARLLDQGQEVIQETRGFDQETGKSYSMRSKEDAQDYRFMPDPDLLPIIVDEKKVEKLRQSLPKTAEDRQKEYMDKYGLRSYDAEILTNSLALAHYFEEAVQSSSSPQILANLIISQLFGIVDTDDFSPPFEAEKLGQLSNLLNQAEINSSASRKILEELVANPQESPQGLMEQLDLRQINDEEILRDIIKEVIESSQKAVKEYKDGKEKALQAIIGRIMGKSKGKANPEISLKLVKEILKD